MASSYEQEHEIERLLTLANIQRNRGQLTEAEDACRKALEISPRNVGALEMLGDILNDCGKFDMALCEYKSALGALPGNAVLETKIAKVILEIAEREREKAIAQDMLDNPHKYTARRRNPLLALICSSVVPGLGQLYNGELVKAVIICGTFLLFILSYALFQPPYPQRIDNIQMFIISTNEFVLVLGMLAFIAYVYGLIDAPFAADKSSKAAKKETE